MYARATTRQMRTRRGSYRLGDGLDLSTFNTVLTTATGAAANVANIVRGPQQVQVPKPAQAAQPSGTNFLDTLSNSELAIGAISTGALLLAVMR